MACSGNCEYDFRTRGHKKCEKCRVRPIDFVIDECKANTLKKLYLCRPCAEKKCSLCGKLTMKFTFNTVNTKTGKIEEILCDNCMQQGQYCNLCKLNHIHIKKTQAPPGSEARIKPVNPRTVM